MRKILICATMVAIALVTAAPSQAGADAASVFEQLKTLQGTWTGTPEGKGEEASAEAERVSEVVHEFAVSAAGTVVMETMGPGSDHEMINMYHLDGDDLVLTHYCAGGNQPRMRLDREASSADSFVFEFSGGTNLDPAVDEHIHSASIRMLEDGRLDSVWQAHSGGEQVGEMAFHLSRSGAEQ
ncbi:MAG: hypothetical protein GY769_03560 [bacterium]|nr:hypothetical protein [bacterium]